MKPIIYQPFKSYFGGTLCYQGKIDFTIHITNRIKKIFKFNLEN